jgi:hypothetical protein
MKILDAIPMSPTPDTYPADVIDPYLITGRVQIITSL